MPFSSRLSRSSLVGGITVLSSAFLTLIADQLTSANNVPNSYSKVILWGVTTTVTYAVALVCIDLFSYKEPVVEQRNLSNLLNQEEI